MKKILFFLLVLTLLGCRSDNPFDGMYVELHKGMLLDSYIIFVEDKEHDKIVFIKQPFTQCITIGTVEYDENNTPYLTERYIHNNCQPADWKIKRLNLRTKEDTLYLYPGDRETFIKQNTKENAELQEKQYALQALALLVAKHDFDM